MRPPTISNSFKSRQIYVTEKLTVDGELSATDTMVIDTSGSNAALRITQRGSGEVIRVEDSSNPDSTPFVITSSGLVGIGTANPTSNLTIAGNVSATNITSSNLTATNAALSSLTVTSNISAAGAIASSLYFETREIRALNNPLFNSLTEIVINAGDSAFITKTSQNDEYLYVNAEKGIMVNSSPDNWTSGWAGRSVAVFNTNDYTGLLSSLPPGRTGLGTVTPNEKLTVIGNISATGNISVSGIRSTSANITTLTATNITSSNLTATTAIISGLTVVNNLTTNGIITTPRYLETREIRALGVTQPGNPNELIINAGDSAVASAPFASSLSGEYLYVNAELGIMVNSSPDNWASGWAGRSVAVFNTQGGGTGLGTVTPNEKLTVVGNISATGNISVSGIQGTNATISNATIPNLTATSAVVTALTATNIATSSLVATNTLVTNHPISAVTATNFLVSAQDSGRVYQLDTTVSDITASFPSTLSNGFFLGLINAGTGTIFLSSASTLYAPGTENSTPNSGMYFYKLNNELYGLGVFV